MKLLLPAAVLLACLASITPSQGDSARASQATPLAIGETFTIESKALAGILKKGAPTALKWFYQPLPEETHATIYHPAALEALRRIFAPAPAK